MNQYTAHPKTLEERFWGYVAKTDTCWLWTRGLNASGYGLVGVGTAKNALAHRIAWQLTHGDIPPKMSVLHRCDVRHCVRPDHLFLGTQTDNMRDCAAKGRASRLTGAHGTAHYKTTLSEADVIAIRAMFAAGTPKREIATKWGLHWEHVHKIVTRITWRRVA